MKKKKKISDVVLDLIIYTILLVLTITTLYPAWYVVVASFSSSAEVATSGGLLIWPKEFMLGAYKLVFKNELLMNGFWNSMKVLIFSLPLNLVMTLFCGYFMACNGMMMKKPIVVLIMFTMFFSGGMIPNYLNIRSLGLLNSIWALVLPGALSVYNAIICKTAIEAIPVSLSESAFIDGANDFHMLRYILVPLLKPTLAVLFLYYGVEHWNSWFNASIYLRDTELLPIQNVLRSLTLSAASSMNEGAGDEVNTYAETIKYAAIVVSTLPIMCVYPFLQKHFTKGVMIGAVKG